MPQLEEPVRAGLTPEGKETDAGEQFIFQASSSGATHFALQTLWALHNQDLLGAAYRELVGSR